MILSYQGSINKHFNGGEEIISSPSFFKQIGIEILKDFPINIIINNKSFTINSNRIFELENIRINSLKFSSSADAAITYILG